MSAICCWPLAIVSGFSNTARGSSAATDRRRESRLTRMAVVRFLDEFPNLVLVQTAVEDAVQLPHRRPKVGRTLRPRAALIVARPGRLHRQRQHTRQSPRAR